ncbi:hypothetical protein [Falsiporphyromonas endometrii]|uniref:Uncharacterized protein n=1 Tax=Falsiporphyromonas endometrii TaxID=1387297 RepID=A0ABV9K7H0_9PORP
MGILVLLTIFLTLVQLGGPVLQGGKIHSFGSEQIVISINNKNNHPDYMTRCAVKHILKRLYLLNTTTLIDTQNGTQTLLIQHQNHKLEG